LTARRGLWPLYFWGLSKTERIFVQHRGQLEKLALAWRGKATVMRSIADACDGFTPHSSRDCFVAWVGMLRHPKRPDLLVEIARRSPDIKYVVCGGTAIHRSPAGYSNDVLAQLQRLPNVIFKGQVSPAEAERIIGQAAILLCTSDEEGFPNTFLQAWSRGTPVVTLQVDPDSLIKTLELGAVTGSLETTIEELDRLLRSPEARQIIAVRCHEYISNNHRAEVVVQAFDKLARYSSGY
jgi:glycosyltransferase involved in cell wall biosynthesis